MGNATVIMLITTDFLQDFKSNLFALSAPLVFSVPVDDPRDHG